MVFHITAKVWTKPKKAASEQSDAAVLGMFVLSLGRFCSHGIFHNTSSLNFNGLKKLVFFGPARFGAHFLKTVVFGKRPYEKNG